MSAILSNSLYSQLGVARQQLDRNPHPTTPAIFRTAPFSSARIARGSYQQIGERTTAIPRALATRASSSPSRDIPKRCSSLAFSRRSIHAENKRTGTPSSSRCRPDCTSWFSPPPGAEEANEGACRMTSPGAHVPWQWASTHSKAEPGSSAAADPR